jgi:5'-3' exonuclease
MGIKYFFGWMKKTFVNHIKTLNSRENLKETVDIDTFLIDMNGIFHYCCQKVYRYGSFKHLAEHKPVKKTNSKHLQLQVCQMIGAYVDKLVAFVQPRKRVVMAVDGSAPLSKQHQQRSRRYKSASDNDDGIFDSNSITPGTLFLDHLSKYLDWHIRSRISDGTWSNIDIIFSSERCPGEGEHKLVKYIRDHCDNEQHDNYMMHGMDADLVMLSLATQKPNFYILRDNPYRYEHEYFYIDLKSIRETLVFALLCEQSIEHDQIYINDFIAMIFFTGNDFLPHIPTINIIDNGIEHLFDTYRKVVKEHGSLTTHANTLNIESLQHLIGTLSQHEQNFLCQKRAKSTPYPDQLLERHTKLLSTCSTDKKEDDEVLYTINFDSYRQDYYTSKMNCKDEKDIEKACHAYIDGLQWVLTYYTKGVSDWQWYYPYRYAPFLSDLAKYLSTYVHVNTIGLKRNPYPPFLQLLCVLPPKSKHLLPAPLSDLMSSPVLKESYPDEFKIDMDGKINDWEGVVLLPDLNTNLIEKEYYKHIKLVDDREKARNMPGKTFSYKFDPNPYFYKSYYGDLKECKTSQTFIHL